MQIYSQNTEIKQKFDDDHGVNSSENIFLRRLNNGILIRIFFINKSNDIKMNLTVKCFMILGAGENTRIHWGRSD